MQIFQILLVLVTLSMASRTDGAREKSKSSSSSISNGDLRDQNMAGHARRSYSNNYKGYGATPYKAAGYTTNYAPNTYSAPAAYAPPAQPYLPPVAYNAPYPASPPSYDFNYASPPYANPYTSPYKPSYKPAYPAVNYGNKPPQNYYYPTATPSYSAYNQAGAAGYAPQPSYLNPPAYGYPTHGYSPQPYSPYTPSAPNYFQHPAGQYATQQTPYYYSYKPLYKAPNYANNYYNMPAQYPHPMTYAY